LLLMTNVKAQNNTSGNSSTIDPKLQSINEGINKIIADITILIKNVGTIVWEPDSQEQITNFSLYHSLSRKDILVLSDRMEFKCEWGREPVLFSSLIDNEYTDRSTINRLDYLNIGFFRVQLFNKGTKLLSDLVAIKKLLIEKQNIELTAFEPIASQYRALKTKPTITEDLRKYIVQANLLNEQKMYEKAAEVYSKAVEIEPTMYPAAYSNLALISAQLKLYHGAIFNMKKYLMLEPDAADARSAQDKIYGWEILMQK